MLFYLTFKGFVELNIFLSSLISGMGAVLMRLIIPDRVAFSCTKQITTFSFPEIPLMEEDP